ncbi:MAG: OsmC family protein [Actinobacteria bacterium]|nr:MAG: OsmC family protein [Actinomycetota bacterium]
MDSEGIRRSIESAVAYVTEHPEEAAYTDSAAVARIDAGLLCRITGPNEASVVTDMPASVGGGDSAPSAGWLFRAAVAGCVATLIAMRAAQRSVTLGDLEVTVDSESDDRGILGIDDTVPAGPLSLQVAVRIASTDGTDRDALVQIVHWAVAHCPVSDAASRSVPMRVDVETGEGRSV